MRRAFVAAIVLCSVACAGREDSAVQQVADSVMVLNRSGRWAEAEQLAFKTLQATPVDRAMVARCQLTESLAYAQVRTKNPAAASATLRVYAGACAAVPQMAGFAAEVAGLQREVAAALAKPS